MPEAIQHKSTKDVSGTGVLATDEEQGIVEAIVSVTGIRDNVNDIIEPGAYAKTLAARRPKGVWSHDWNTPVSKALDVEEWMPGDSRLPATLADGKAWPAEAGALWVKAQFNLKTNAGRDAFENVRFFGEDGEWSIGYTVPKNKATEEKSADSPSGKIRRIKELNLFEFSPVLFGAASNARTFASSIKSMFATEEAKEEFIKALEDEDQSETNVSVNEITKDEEKHQEVENPEELLSGPEGAEEVKEVREVAVNVNMTAAVVEQLKTLKSEIDKLLDSVVVQEEVKVETANVEAKGLDEAIEDLVTSGVGVKTVEDIELRLNEFQKSLDQKSDDVNDRAILVLDLIGEALADVSDAADEKSLKVLAASVGEALRDVEEKSEETIEIEKTETKTVTISTEDLINLKNLSL